MARFLIELKHSAETLECVRAVQILLKTGSHFLTNAEWGCRDGEHSAWLIVDIDSKEEARSILPPVYRKQAKIVQLNRFSLDEMDEIVSKHQGDQGA